MPSRLDELQQQFRNRLLKEKESKMIKIYNENQQKAIQKCKKSNSFEHLKNRGVQNCYPPSVKTIPPVSNSGRAVPGAKRGSPGLDRSRPLAPISKDQISGSTNNSPTLSPVSSQNLPQLQITDTNNKPLERLPEQPNEKKQRSILAQSRAKYPLEKLKQSHVNMKQKDATFVATIKEQQTEMKKMTLNKKAPIPKGPVLIKRMNSLPNSLNEKTQVIDPSQLRFNLVACSICNRTFAKDQIKKHSGICRKTTQKRRKVFDATKMRVKGTEAENFVKGKPKKDDQKPPKNNWRIKHETLIASIRQAKVIQQHVAAGGKLSDLPPPPTVENPDYIPCPYCNRTFSQAAADRHIPKCKNIISNKKTKV